jgi:hypothetical protein
MSQPHTPPDLSATLRLLQPQRAALWANFTKISGIVALLTVGLLLFLLLVFVIL